MTRSTTSSRTIAAIQRDINTVRGLRREAIEAGDYALADDLTNSIDALGDELTSCEEAVEYFTDRALAD